MTFVIGDWIAENDTRANERVMVLVIQTGTMFGQFHFSAALGGPTESEVFGSRTAALKGRFFVTSKLIAAIRDVLHLFKIVAPG